MLLKIKMMYSILGNGMLKEAGGGPACAAYPAWNQWDRGVRCGCPCGISRPTSKATMCPRINRYVNYVPITKLPDSPSLSGPLATAAEGTRGRRRRPSGGRERPGGREDPEEPIIAYIGRLLVLKTRVRGRETVGKPWKGTPSGVPWRCR
jgi:hypothetical protein